MAEILTESFCERCGTRYTFESPARRTNPLGALGTVGRGLRNFVASGDHTIDEAFAVARAETEQRATAHQLEAFHQTFNFCLSCRQYTCSNCWNPVEGRCQSCAPMPEAEMLAAADAAPDSPVIAEAMAIAWAATSPPSELEAPADPELVEIEAEAVYEPAPEALDEPAPAAAWEPTPEPEPQPEPEPEPEPEPAFEPEPEPEPAAEFEPEPERAAEPETVFEPEREPEPAAVFEPGLEPVEPDSASRAGSPITTFRFSSTISGMTMAGRLN